MEKIIVFVYDRENTNLENNVNVPCSYLDYANISALAEIDHANVTFIFEEYTATYDIKAFLFKNEFLEQFMKRAVI